MRRLPLLVERSIQEAAVVRYDLSLKAEMAARSEGTLSCTKGCHNCCYHPVYLSVLEGVTLFRWLSEKGLWTKTLKAKFEDTHEKTWGLSLEVWALSLVPCPLLSGTSCSAYEGRPLSCRITYSREDPKDCHPHRLAGQVLLPKREIAEQMAKVEQALLKRHDLKLLPIPLASAVLTGERICKGEFDLEESLRFLMVQQERLG